MLEEDCKMKWVLFVVLASTSGSEKAINSTAVPTATEQLCNAAKEKLTQAYRNTQSPNYVLVTECLQARSADWRTRAGSCVLAPHFSLLAM
jgi:uncharacterized membrane protein